MDAIALIFLSLCAIPEQNVINSSLCIKWSLLEIVTVMQECEIAFSQAAGRHRESAIAT